ncbi:MAG: hypothetical protein ACI8R9_002203 [Paraglaciecola sp.]|jgi:hypothetical protein
MILKEQPMTGYFFKIAGFAEVSPSAGKKHTTVHL